MDTVGCRRSSNETLPCYDEVVGGGDVNAVKHHGSEVEENRWSVHLSSDG